MKWIRLRFAGLLDQVQPSETAVMLATAVTVGAGTGLGAILFIRLIAFVQTLFFESGAIWFGFMGRGIFIIAPLIGGLLAGLGAFAIVGMAAVFAGAARAPFTAILIVFEMTDDYHMIVPLMAGVIVSLLVAERLHRESIYTLKLTRRGIHLRRGRDVDVMESVRVEEVMVREPVTIPLDMPVSLLADEFLRTGRHGFAVINEDGSLFGMVLLEDLRQITEKDAGSSDQLTIREIATREIVTTFPDETVGMALRRMAPRDLLRLPVVSRDDSSHLLGVIRRNDIVRAYEVGVVRREEARHRAEATQAVNHARAEFVEVTIPPGSLVTGLTVAELDLPRAAVLVSIRRGRDLLIPHGDTKLESGDAVTGLCERQYSEELRAALTK